MSEPYKYRALLESYPVSKMCNKNDIFLAINQITFVSKAKRKKWYDYLTLITQKCLFGVILASRISCI